MIPKISEVMTKNVVTADRKTLISDVVDTMARKKISCIVIIDHNKKPVGIVTERDMIRRVLKNCVDIEKTPVEDIMSSPIITITSEKKITDAIVLMKKYHIRRMVIVSSKSTLEGVLTQTDLVFEVQKTKTELDMMSTGLRNSIKCLNRLSSLEKESEKSKALREKIKRLEKELDRTKKMINKVSK